MYVATEQLKQLGLLIFPHRSFTTHPGSDEMSPGLVQDGTKCGNDKVRVHIG